MYPMEAPVVGQLATSGGPVAPPWSNPCVQPLALMLVVLHVAG